MRMDKGSLYTVSKDCPVNSHLCAENPMAIMEGINCGFYNGYKKRCVFPRTVIHNCSSDQFINLYDRFSGNIGRYFEGPTESTAEGQVTLELQKRGIIPKGEEVLEEGAESFEGWAYAEFEDDGNTVKLVEIGTDEEVAELLDR